MRSRQYALLLLMIGSLGLGGCTAVALVDATAATVIGVGTIAIKGTVAVVEAVIPDGDNKVADDDDDDKDKD